MEEDSGGVEDGPKYKEEDWRNSDFRGVGIYEEEWTVWRPWRGTERSEDSVMCGYG